MGDEGISPRASADFSPPSPRTGSMQKISRKRTLSAANDGSPLYMGQGISPRSSTRLPSVLSAGWYSDPTRNLPPIGLSSEPNAESPFRSQYSPGGMPFWKHSQVDFGRKSSGNIAFETDNRGSIDSSQDAILNWDEQIIDEYD
jgi:hypothetical protein